MCVCVCVCVFIQKIHISKYSEHFFNAPYMFSGKAKKSLPGGFCMVLPPVFSRP